MDINLLLITVPWLQMEFAKLASIKTKMESGLYLYGKMHLMENSTSLPAISHHHLTRKYTISKFYSCNVL